MARGPGARVAPVRRLPGVEIIVIGSSWGGLSALELVLSGLPAGLPAAVVLAQHRSSGTSVDLAALLRKHTALEVREVQDKDEVVPGWVFIAPADYHLLVEPGSFALSVEGRVQFSRPSIDVLFESAALSYGSRAVAVVLTGANTDGAAGMEAVKQAGGQTIVQDPVGAERSTMPAAAVATGAADHVVALPEIATLLVGLCAASGSAAR